MYIGGLIKQNITLALQKKSVVLASLKKSFSEQNKELL